MRNASRGILLLVVLLAAACVARGGSSSPAVPAPPPTGTPDTIVLVRTACFGRCPAYELVVPRGAPVRVEGDRDRARRAAGRVVPDSVLDALARQAAAGGFYALPARTSDDDRLCRMRATDQPSVTVRIVQGHTRTEVVDYLGCYVSIDPPRRDPALVALGALAAAIDSVAGTGEAR